ncbi:helix-turn-helix domain-containing protein [Kitasatospora sp. NBC_01302]|uniref:helix-turn-helix domain-containing protein n=1 Tax=Kitasatospora sp. NBC_01302 TaxID=2903575 RepID=UPI003FA389BD
MGRKKTPIMVESPLQPLAQFLRDLRERAGLTYRQMVDVLEGRQGCSLATLSRADRGTTLPTFKTVEGYVSACGGDLVVATRLWQQAVRDYRYLDRNPGKPIPRRRPRPVVDPDFIYEPLQLRDAMVHMRMQAGDPSLRQLAAGAQALGLGLPRSTLSDVLAGRRLPSPSMLRAFVRVCRDGRPVDEWDRALLRVVVGRHAGLLGNHQLSRSGTKWTLVPAAASSPTWTERFGAGRGPGPSRGQRAT